LVSGFLDLSRLKGERRVRQAVLARAKMPEF
jgi:hypothetical protein